MAIIRLRVGAGLPLEQCVGLSREDKFFGKGYLILAMVEYQNRSQCDIKDLDLTYLGISQDVVVNIERLFIRPRSGHHTCEHQQW
jgi:hypothetical protein